MTLETEQFLLGATDLDCFGRATPGLSPTAPEALPHLQACAQSSLGVRDASPQPLFDLASLSAHHSL